MTNPWAAYAAGFGFLAVGFGAFAAHGLEGQVSERALNAIETGSEYALAHAIALFALAVWNENRRPLARLAGWAFVSGIVLFSGSLFVFGLSGFTAHLWITPIGGVLLLAGWALVFAAAIAKGRGSD